LFNKNETTGFLLHDGGLDDVYEKNSPSIFYLRIELSRKEQFFKRKVYTLLDMIGDIGALSDGLILIIGFFLNSYNDSHFLSLIMESLFTVNSEESPRIKKIITGRLKQADLENITSNLQK